MNQKKKANEEGLSLLYAKTYFRATVVKIVYLCREQGRTQDWK